MYQINVKGDAVFASGQYYDYRDQLTHGQVVSFNQKMSWVRTGYQYESSLKTLNLYRQMVREKESLVSTQVMLLTASVSLYRSIGGRFFLMPQSGEQAGTKGGGTGGGTVPSRYFLMQYDDAVLRPTSRGERQSINRALSNTVELGIEQKNVYPMTVTGIAVEYKLI